MWAITLKNVKFIDELFDEPRILILDTGLTSAVIPLDDLGLIINSL